MFHQISVGGSHVLVGISGCAWRTSFICHTWPRVQDALGVSAFSTSHEAFAAEDLINAYRTGDAAAVKAVAAKPLFKTIDNQVHNQLCNRQLHAMLRGYAGVDRKRANAISFDRHNMRKTSCRT